LLQLAGTALSFRAARREEEQVMQRAAQATAALNLVIVEDDPVVRQFLKDTVEQLGHHVTGEAATGADMVRTVLAVEPDIVLFDIHLPGLNGLDALRQIYQERVVAAVAITADRDQDLVRRALEEHVLAYLVKPIEAHQIGPALMVAKARFGEWRGLQEENENLRKTLENRKTIERAKGVLMKRHRWSEAEAFRRLQRAAMNRRTTMVDLAQSVLNGVEIEL
jgi:response regulator NasT